MKKEKHRVLREKISIRTRDSMAEILKQSDWEFKNCYDRNVKDCNRERRQHAK